LQQETNNPTYSLCCLEGGVQNIQRTIPTIINLGKDSEKKIERKFERVEDKHSK
jgi:hypothetical protein